jgi:hypothetical protein
VREIRIYVEGGGDSRDTKAQLRQGMDMLLRAPKEASRKKRLSWTLAFCGGRGQAFDAFRNALRQYDRETVVVLLVDSEDPIGPESADAGGNARARREHLAKRDGWDFSAVEPDQVHLMVQCMEAWIVADAEAVEAYYGQGFLAARLPDRANLEEEPKSQVVNSLKHATRKTTKGEYAKIRDASRLLERIEPGKVGRRCPRFVTFTSWLTERIHVS